MSEIKIGVLKIPKPKSTYNTIPKPLPNPDKGGMRAIFVGSSGSGKTGSLIYMLNEYYYSYFTHRCFFCSTEFQPIWDTLKKKKNDLWYSSFDDSVVERVFEWQKNNKKMRRVLFIIDDVTKDEMKSKLMCDGIRWLRHHGCSLVILTQKYNLLSTCVRSNSTHLLLFSVSSNQELNTITSDIPFLNIKTLNEMYIKKEKDWNDEKKEKGMDIPHPFIYVNKVDSTVSINFKKQ